MGNIVGKIHSTSVNLFRPRISAESELTDDEAEAEETEISSELAIEKNEFVRTSARSEIIRAKFGDMCADTYLGLALTSYGKYDEPIPMNRTYSLRTSRTRTYCFHHVLNHNIRHYMRVLGIPLYGHGTPTLSRVIIAKHYDTAVFGENQNLLDLKITNFKAMIEARRELMKFLDEMNADELMDSDPVIKTEYE